MWALPWPWPWSSFRLGAGEPRGEDGGGGDDALRDQHRLSYQDPWGADLGKMKILWTVVQLFKMIWYLDNTSDPLCRMGASFLRRVGAKQRWRIFRQIIIFEKKVNYTIYTIPYICNPKHWTKTQQHLKAGLGNKMGNRASGSRKVGSAAPHGIVRHLHHWQSTSYFGKSQFKLLFAPTQEIFIDYERYYIH